MKKMLFTFTFLLLLFASCSKESKQEKELREAREEIESFFSTSLSDPHSLEIHDMSHTGMYGIYDWTVDYSARNGFGGRTRETVTFHTRDGKIIFMNGQIVVKVNNEYIILQ